MVVRIILSLTKSAPAKVVGISRHISFRCRRAPPWSLAISWQSPHRIRGARNSRRAGGAEVEGAVPTPLSLTADDLAKTPRATAPLSADGTTTTYEGVFSTTSW